MLPRLRHTVLLLLAMAVATGPACGRERKKKNAAKPQEENVIRVKITVDIKELRDSIEASDRRGREELELLLLEESDSLRGTIYAAIDEITGFGGGLTGRWIVDLAMEHLGKPYRLGAGGPEVFDCSGLTRYVYREAGISIPRYSREQYAGGRAVSTCELREGALVFFGTRKNWDTVGHVGIVVSVDRDRGTFRFINATSSGGVRICRSTDRYFSLRYIGARRYVPEGR